MTRNKAWRLSLTFILMFGWLFLTPAYSNDPLSLAAEEIAELNEKVTNLTEEADTRALIDIAEDKYDEAVAAKAAIDTAYQHMIQQLLQRPQHCLKKQQLRQQ